MLTEACPGAKSSGCRLHQRLLWGYHLHQCEWDTEAVHFQGVGEGQWHRTFGNLDLGGAAFDCISGWAENELDVCMRQRVPHPSQEEERTTDVDMRAQLAARVFLHEVMEGFAQSATSIWLRFRIRLVGHTVTHDSRRILSVQTGGIHPRNSFLLFQWRSQDLRFQLQLQRSCGAVSGLWVLRVAESESDVDITTAPAHSCGMFRWWQWSCMPQLMALQMAPQMAAPMAGKCLLFGKRWDKTCRPLCRHVLRSRAFQWRRSTESSQHEMTWNRNRHVSTRPWTSPSGMGIGSVSCSKKWTAGNAKETEISKDGRVCATFGHEERRRCKAAWRAFPA